MAATGTGSREPVEVPEKEPRRYRGRTPDERRRLRRQRLLDAALDLFGTAGYQNTSVERLCSTSGVTGRHFYEEFPSRAALLTALYDDIMAHGMNAVVEVVEAAPARLNARLYAGVSAYVHLLLDDPRNARIVTAEVIGVDPELEEHRRAATVMFADYIRTQADALTAVGLEMVGNELTAFALVAAVHELTAAYLSATEPIEVDDVIHEAVRIITAVALAPYVDPDT